MSATMRAALASAFGQPDDVINVAPSHPKPQLQPKSKDLLINVKACSLSPGDYRRLRGEADGALPKVAFPYIPGGDVCGVVEAVGQDVQGFKAGDEVIATWSEFGKGGLADYTVVDSKLAALKPPGLSYTHGAAIVNSPVNALLACDDGQLAAGDRILVLGGSGAVGGSVVQLARRKGAAFIAATSTHEDLVKSLGADVVIDYTKQNWWEVPEFVEEPFDLIIDMAEGRSAWAAARQHKVLKPGTKGGRFVAGVPQEWLIEIHSAWQMATWFAPVVGRSLRSRIVPSCPRYVMLMPAPRGDSMQRFLDIFAEGDFKVVLDEGPVHPFTTEGVCAAFNRMISRRATGKVVITLE
eukprot:jgi/Ulvmu1/1337/UM011_0065.1